MVFQFFKTRKVIARVFIAPPPFASGMLVPFIAAFPPRVSLQLSTLTVFQRGPRAVLSFLVSWTVMIGENWIVLLNYLFLEHHTVENLLLVHSATLLIKETSEGAGVHFMIDAVEMFGATL